MMTRPLATLTYEIAATRAEIQRLLHREVQLAAAIETHAEAAAPMPRPGWPFRPLPGDRVVASLH